jgi:hypothetical protein
MMGEEAEPGMIPLMLDELFKCVPRRRRGWHPDPSTRCRRNALPPPSPRGVERLRAERGRQFLVLVSYLEIYNDVRAARGGGSLTPSPVSKSSMQ